MKNKFFDKDPSNGPDGKLVKIFREIIRKKHLLPHMKNLVRLYAEKDSVTRSDTNKKANNMLNHLRKNKMTFKTLVTVFQQVLKAHKLEVTITATFSDGSQMSHDETLLLNELDSEEIGEAIDESEEEVKEEKENDGST